MADEVDRMFEPSFFGWMGLVPQMLRSYKLREDPDFLSRFSRMKQVRDDLKRIEVGLTRWLHCTSRLSSAAKDLGKAVGTKPKAFEETAWNLDLELKDTSALQNIREKIAMIDTLIAQRSKLKYIRLKGEFADHKLRQLRQKQNAESFAALSERYLTIQKESTRQREDIMAQILLVVNKYVDQADEHGVSDLVKPQLQAFKLSQFHVFLNCQKLIAGPSEESYIAELETHWQNFTQRIANDIPNHRAGGSFVASTKVLAEKLEQQSEKTLSVNSTTQKEAEKPKVKENKDNLKKSVKAVVNKEENNKKDKKEYRDSDFDGEDLDDVKSEPELNNKKKKNKKKDETGEDTDLEDEIEDDDN